ncbi:PREDICTED: 5-formyltetrahydrofolate cyclo-ligase [Ceratosolen solmsi marchali]|uniref:5-formyltetrahydrofolate cyclo-ligase n=1 Tax=Ceratosolen solmsi marchali TaxID=326594 RepID=A0AAJ6YML4_9HYME|nr:PREDICTED: 5-formyltetrahydrofolate cyclo-ligase [Ceratosolen solmsi marchali]
MSTIKSAKITLRKKMLNVLNDLDNNKKKLQSEIIFNKLVSLPQYNESKKIALYLSTPNEVDTIPILKDIFSKKKDAFVPCYQKETMNMMKIYSMEDYNKLPLTKWNIKQPDSQEIREKAFETSGLDLIILPGLAFTRDGKRLGHGKGYYDKYIKSIVLDGKQMPYLIALSFNEQIHENIPTNENDMNVNIVLTEKDDVIL